MQIKSIVEFSCHRFYSCFLSQGELVMSIGRLSIATITLTFLWSATAFAQEVNGVLGSSSATTTITGKQLPPPDPKFGGVIKDGALQSKAWWAPRIVPPKGAPNVLLIITDDAGFGVPSTFGGVIPTPTMDRIAARVCVTTGCSRPHCARRRELR